MGRYGGWGRRRRPVRPRGQRQRPARPGAAARRPGPARRQRASGRAAVRRSRDDRPERPLHRPDAGARDVPGDWRTWAWSRGRSSKLGSGAGQFAAFAPDGIRITGVELDPATALIAQLLHPDAEILVGSVSGPRFARVRDQSANPVRVPRDTADGFAGNVPFSDVKWPDEVLNPGTKFPLHDHAIMWGVTRVAPGGLCAFITSRYTADKQNPGFRRTLAGEMDLIGMVRLPSTAHKRMAGTPVVTDIIIGRRLADGERPRTDPETWEQARPLPLPGSSLTALVNTYFHANPQHVLGTLTAGGMRRADDFSVAPSGDLEQQLGAALGEIAGRALAAGQRHEPRPAARPVIEILSRRPDGTVTAQPGRHLHPGRPRPGHAAGDQQRPGGRPDPQARRPRRGPRRPEKGRGRLRGRHRRDRRGARPHGRAVRRLHRRVRGDRAVHRPHPAPTTSRPSRRSWTGSTSASRTCPTPR